MRRLLPRIAKTYNATAISGPSDASNKMIAIRIGDWWLHGLAFATSIFLFVHSSALLSSCRILSFCIFAGTADPECVLGHTPGSEAQSYSERSSFLHDRCTCDRASPTLTGRWCRAVTLIGRKISVSYIQETEVNSFLGYLVGVMWPLTKLRGQRLWHREDQGSG